MSRSRSGARNAAAMAAALGLLAACGGGAKQDLAAYEACLASAKAAGSKIAGAKFATFDESKITGSTGEEEIRVNIPYELAGAKALFQCIAQKQRDGAFKVVF